MDTKLFTLDKNYILKEAQIKLRAQLLRQLVSDVKSIYIEKHNPLGLLDDTISKIRSTNDLEIDYLDSFYYELAGIYRMKYGENQLEFLFDGSSHYIKYKKEWKRKFQKWMNEFYNHKHFLRAVLEGSFLKPEEEIQKNIQIRLKLFLEQQFHLRVYKYRGIRKLKLA
jgi:hypothetical protein